MRFYLTILYSLTTLLTADAAIKYDEEHIIPQAVESKQYSIEDAEFKMLGDGLVFGSIEDVNSSDVIIPEVFKGKYETPKESVALSENEPNATVETPAEASPKVFANSKVRVQEGEQNDTCQAFQVGDKTVPDINGIYTLDRGVERNIEIQKAILVVERLDLDDFGYYYITQLKSYPVNGYYGIFHFDQENQKFMSKIYDSNTTTNLRDNIVIKYDEDQLETIVSISVGKRAIIWNKEKDLKDTNELHLNSTLQDALDEAQDSYFQIYKKHPCFLEKSSITTLEG